MSEIPLKKRKTISIPSSKSVSIGAITILAIIPFFAGSFWTYSLGISFANSLGILSLSVLVRYGGEVSIGHSFFVALGAYCVGIGEISFGMPAGVTLFIAPVIGALSGILFAYPSRSLSGVYLAVASMALALAVPELLMAGTSLTGGYQGLYVSSKIIPGISKSVQGFYIPLLVLIFVVWILSRFSKSPQASALLITQANPKAAESFGITRVWARLSVMAISAAIAATSGALYAFASSTVSPNSFSLWTAIFLLVGSVVSLYSLSLLPVILGGLFLTILPQILSGSGDWVPVFYGAAMLFVILTSSLFPALRSALVSKGK